MKVVSTSLFSASRATDAVGAMERYQAHLPAALRAHHNIFRGWIYRIYHDGTYASGSYGATLDRLAARGLVELRRIDEPPYIDRAMLWRLAPLWDSDVERFLMRDVDMVATYRERRAVEEWVRSGLACHAMGDAQAHTWPTMGGMMGFRVAEAGELLDAGPGRRIATLGAFLDRAGWSEAIWSRRKRACQMTSANQFFLSTHVWPQMQRQACEHRLRNCPTHDAKLSLTKVALFDGEDFGVDERVRAGSDDLVPFIGASRANSKIDLDAIAAFYRERGDPAVEHAIAECEAAA